MDFELRAVMGDTDVSKATRSNEECGPGRVWPVRNRPMRNRPMQNWPARNRQGRGGQGRGGQWREGQGREGASLNSRASHIEAGLSSRSEKGAGRPLGMRWIPIEGRPKGRLMDCEAVCGLEEGMDAALAQRRLDRRRTPPTSNGLRGWMATALACLVWGALLATPSSATALLDCDDGPNDGDETWKIYRPLDGAKFPAGTRIVSVIGVKPFGSAALIRVEDPHGNSEEYLSPAIRTFFSITLDKSGEPLAAGKWEATLVHTLWPNVAMDQVTFTVEEGESTHPLPTLETPATGEVYPSNIPFVIFSGVSDESTSVWIRLIDLDDDRAMLVHNVETAAHNVWAYAYSWSYGEGNWQIQVFASNPNLGGDPTDWHNFKTVDYRIEKWPVKWYWEW